MSKCQCDLRTKLVGDGCRYCNAQEYIDKLIEALEEQRTWVGLTDKEFEDLVEDEDWFNDPVNFAKIIQTKLKELNT